MATLYTERSHNIAKTWIMMSLFFVVVIAIGWFFGYYYNDPSFLYLAVIISIVMNIWAYWFGDKVTLAISGAKPATREASFDLYTTVENLSITAGLPMPKIYIIPDPAPNAFATGRDKKHASVAVTSGLLNIMNKTELEGVIAHELSHVGNRDILLSTVVVVLVGMVTLLSDWFIRISFFGGGRGGRKEGEGGNILAIVGIIFVVLSPIIATLIQLAISRRREALADASGALLTRYPEGLADALEKIAQYNAPMQKATNATAHLYISNPFGPHAKTSFIAKLFMTHPPIEERIATLRAMA
jgi:heat shock protein HtpX